MAVDLQNRPSTPDSDDLNPGNKHYDDVLNKLTSAEHKAKVGQRPSSDTAGKAGAAAVGAATAIASGGGIGGIKAGLSKLGGALWSSRKRKAGTVTGGALILAVAGFSIGSLFLTGSLQAVHLGEMLAKNYSKSNSDSANRNGRFLRYAKTGNIAETRLGTAGSKIYGTTITQLKNIGVEIETGTTGQPTKTTYDTKKLQKSIPELAGKDIATQKALLAERLGVSVEAIKGTGNILSIDQAKMGIGDTRLLAKSSVSLLNDGKIIGGMKSRTLVKALDLPSLFHPIKRAKASLTKKYVNGKPVDEKKQAADEEAQEKKALVEAAAGDGAATSVEDAKGKLSGAQAQATRALTFTGLACQANSVADEVVTIDRARVVLPAIAESTHVMALGSQVKSNNDITLLKLGAVVNTFTDKQGKTIWQSKPLQALSGKKDIKGLQDIDNGQKQAFGSHDTVNTIHETVSKATLGQPGLACNPVSLAAQGAATLAIAGGETFASGGLATPALIAQFGAKQAAQVYLTGKVIGFLEKIILNSTTADALAEDAFNGISGGALYAYGARAAANQAAIATGGIPLGNKGSILADAQAEAQDKQEFASKNTFAQFFDVKDYRSVSGRFIDSVSPQPMTNVASLFSSLGNVGSLIPKTFAQLFPSVSAATKDSYDWGFSQVGIPQSMLDDPSLADPYANANDVAKMLDAQCKNGDGTANTDCALIKRVKACFGNDITHEDDENGKPLWDAVVTQNSSAQESIDPNSDAYINNDCGNVADQNWRRVVMFVSDSSTMKAVACYEGDDDSCSDLGIAHADTSGGATKGAGQFTVATYNLLNADIHGGDSVNVAGGCNTGQDPACVTKRTDLQAKIISGKNGNPAFDILGTQETSPGQYMKLKKALAATGANYDSAPEADKDIQRLTQAKNGALAIFWNSDMFTKIEEGKSAEINNVPRFGGGHITSPYVHLQTTGGQDIYVLSIHYANQHYYDTSLGDDGTMRESSRVTMQWVSSIKNKNPDAIVIVMGDFNDTPGQKLSYCIYTHNGLMQNTADMARGVNPDKECPNPGKVYGIDHVYATPNQGLTASDWKHISDDDPVAKHASDHTPVYVTLKLAGEDDDTQAIAGKGFAGKDGFTSGSCVAYVKYILGRHSSKYHGGSLGNGKDVANNLGGLGYTVDHTPAVHAVVSFPTTLANATYGHVGIVAQINSDGSIVVEESNWANVNHYGTHVVKASVVPQLTYAHTEVGWH